jgi:membrane protein implicated in regulation of membrane protease activity
MTRKLEWGGPPHKPTKRPYRDTFLVYGVLALIVVIIAWLTGGSLARAIVIALIFFGAASLWNVYRLRTRRDEDTEGGNDHGDGP